MQERAIFINRATALKVAAQAALAAGAEPDAVPQHAKSRPVIRRGELKGYEAWFRPRYGEPMQAIVEH